MTPKLIDLSMGMAKNLQIHTEPVVQASVFAVVYRKVYVGSNPQPSGWFCVYKNTISLWTKIN
jgi:hypothetical protein